MKKNKKYIIIISILIIYLISMVFIFNKDLFINKKDKLYLMVSPDTRWIYEKGNWNNIDDVTQYSMKEFNTFVNSEFYGKYSLVYNDKFYLFDENKKSQKYQGDLIAYRGSLPIDIIKFEQQKVGVNDEFIQKVINDNDLQNKFTEVYTWFVRIDIDNDGEFESIYTIDNTFSINQEKIFGIIFIVDDYKIKYLYKNIDDGEYPYKNCKPYLKNIIDLNKDKNYEFIVSCENYGNSGTCNNLFDSKKNDYKILKSC